MPATSDRPSKKLQAGLLPALPSFSLRQLADAWNLDEAFLKDCVRKGVLRAHLLLHGVRGNSNSGQVLLEGYYRLPPASAHILLSGWHPALSDFGHEQGPIQVTKEPNDVLVTLAGSAVSEVDICVLREEAERFEGEHLAGQATEDSEPVRPSQRARESVRAVAALLWDQDSTRNLNIEQMLDRRELTKFGLELAGHRGYTRPILRRWISDLCPNPKAGRPPKN